VSEVANAADARTTAFDQFYMASTSPLMGMAYVLTGSVPAAQDLVQETLLRTWLRWTQISRYDDPLAWARQVLYNLAISESRREHLRRSRMAILESTPPPSETHLMLAEILRKLPGNQARALVLHDGAGLPVREIAAEMKVPEGTVRSWLSRGRAAAAAALSASAFQSEEGHAQH
jgi:RNA polymerase sigma-70 factor (ECF subfamily)